MPFSTSLDGVPATQLRGLMWLELCDVGQVLRGSAVSDSGGGVTETWGTAGTLACRIDPIGTGRVGRETGGAIDERSTHVVTVPSGGSLAVSTGDLFDIGGRGTYEVTATRDRTRSWSTQFEVIIR